MRESMLRPSICIFVARSVLDAAEDATPLMNRALRRQEKKNG